MSLHVRVDDFPGTKPEEFHKHNLENFKRFDHQFEKRAIPYVLGVIPGYTTPRDLSWFRERKHVTVAMHGIIHDESHLDEFRDRSYRDIETAIHTVKDRLEAVLSSRVVDYVPPHNVVNADTVLALSRLGFERVYGGPETDDDMKRFIEINGMDYVHSEPLLEYGRSDELVERGSVEHLLEKAPRVDTYLTLHWTWEHNIGLSYLETYFDLLGKLWND